MLLRCKRHHHLTFRANSRRRPELKPYMFDAVLNCNKGHEMIENNRHKLSNMLMIAANRFCSRVWPHGVGLLKVFAVAVQTRD